MGNPNLEPVEGVTCEQWAAVNAKLASGASKDDAIKGTGMDIPKWDRVNTEWLTRMRNDTSFTISKIYSASFNMSATGNVGAGSQVDSSSYPFEKYIEAMVAQDVLGKMGRDAQDVLKDFGLTVADYSNISSYWSAKMMTDFSLAAQMMNLQNQYKQKYESMKGEDTNKDIEF